jgi:membrane protease YdiL (CAAX protease family)
MPARSPRTSGMSRVLSPVRRFPVSTFLAVSLLWSWRPAIAALLAGEPIPGLDPFGPAIAAAVVALATEGRAGLSRLLRACVAWRAPARWWLFALGLPLALSLAAAAANVALGAPMPARDALLDVPRLLLVFPFVLVLGGPLGEEPGWRGFLLPRLSARRSELAAALLVGAAWALWHLPLLVSSQRAVWLPFVLGVVVASIPLARLQAATGSVLLAMIFHAAQNTVGGEWLGPMFSGADAVRLAWLRAAAYAVATVAILAWRSPRARGAAGAASSNPALRLP